MTGWSEHVNCCSETITAPGRKHLPEYRRVLVRYGYQAATVRPGICASSARVRVGILLLGFAWIRNRPCHSRCCFTDPLHAERTSLDCVQVLPRSADALRQPHPVHDTAAASRHGWTPSQKGIL